MKIDLKGKINMLPVDIVKVGHGAYILLWKVTTVEAFERRKIKKNAHNFVDVLIGKVKEWSSLCYMFTKVMTSLSPTQISALQKLLLDECIS